MLANICPMIPVNSVVQLECELDDSCVLRTAGYAHIHSAAGCAGTVEVHVIESIQEVAAELHPHSFRDSEVLLQAQVDIRITGATNRSLRRAISVNIGRIGIGCVVKPLVANELGGIAGIESRFPAKGFPRSRPAIWAQTTAEGTRGIASAKVEVIQS